MFDILINPNFGSSGGKRKLSFLPPPGLLISESPTRSSTPFHLSGYRDLPNPTDFHVCQRREELLLPGLRNSFIPPLAHCSHTHFTCGGYLAEGSASLQSLPPPALVLSTSVTTVRAKHIQETG